MKRPETIFHRIIRENEHDRTRCWLWTGATINGYGTCTVTTPDGGKVHKLAHRHAYETIRGPIPNGLPLDHLCRTPLCINPWHTEPVTPRENVMRGASFMAARARQTHCKRGHPFTPENTRRKGNGTRECLTCHRPRHLIRNRRYKAKLRAARTHCARGHALTPDNIYVRANGWRLCSICFHAHQRAASAIGNHPSRRPRHGPYRST